MDWLEITVPTTPDKLEDLMGRLEDLGIEGLVVNDEASVKEYLDSNPTAWDYVDDDVFSELRGRSSLQFYLEAGENGAACLERYKSSLPEETFEVRQVRDEDWQNNWKNFFKPFEIGSRLMIVPEWEPIPEHGKRTVLRIEPKLAFGTGSHASTRMCLEELENHRGQSVLDLGCGSGILAVAALLFGADRAVCCDIAPDAAAVVLDNAGINNLHTARLDVYTADILTGSTLQDITGGIRFDIVFANIIADVIISLAPKVRNLLSPGDVIQPAGIFICSGIIDGRQEAVRAALCDNGLDILSHRQSEGWHMFAARAVVSGDGS